MRLLATILFVFILNSLIAQSNNELYVSEFNMYLTSCSKLQQIDQKDPEHLVFQNKNKNMAIEFMKFPVKMSLQNFLKKQLNSKALCSSSEFIACSIDGHDALTVKVNCLEMRQPMKMMLVCFKKDKEIHLIQFKCPEECYFEHCKEIEEFLSSIRFPSEEQSDLLFAETTKIT